MISDKSCAELHFISNSIRKNIGLLLLFRETKAFFFSLIKKNHKESPATLKFADVIYRNVRITNKQKKATCKTILSTCKNEFKKLTSLLRTKYTCKLNFMSALIWLSLVSTDFICHLICLFVTLRNSFVM